MPVQFDPEGIETKYLNGAADLANARVLEIGCGEGRLIWSYAHVARSVTGIDLKLDRLTTAFRNCPSELRSRLTVVQATTETLPFPSERFDRAILAWSL